MTKCRWCPRTFEAKPGKEFCSTACRTQFHAALRAWGTLALDRGLVTVETLKAVLAACTAAEETIDA